MLHCRFIILIILLENVFSVTYVTNMLGVNNLSCDHNTDTNLGINSWLPLMYLTQWKYKSSPAASRRVTFLVIT
ncbi:hypothetical protein HanLR1_Chr10g0370491 [Helianthus annuus]|nr:hypothetical protein HanHA89_Chr10g0393151 [Helianthus annuus]KAJ0697577.1 hypothetical protein HanLR1_Chr10g0370491 [Helianthus annuus]